MCLQTAFLDEAQPNPRDVRLGIPQRRGRGEDRERGRGLDRIVRGGRAENESSVGWGLELDGSKARQVPCRKPGRVAPAR